MAAARVSAVVLFFLLGVTVLSGRLRGATYVPLLILAAGFFYVVSNNERLQRFTTLGDIDRVLLRVEGSVNLTFFELVLTYPMGNGLGAGGTSIPSFLHNQIKNPVVMENEYSRILLELGLPGLLLWLAFFAWVLSRPVLDKRDPWLLGRTLMFYLCVANLLLSLIGIGLLTSIPSTALLLVGMGFMVAGTAPQPAGAKPALAGAPNGRPAVAGYP
jgi:hypothetical protein